jgi:hypothetical protein
MIPNFTDSNTFNLKKYSILLFCTCCSTAYSESFFEDMRYIGALSLGNSTSTFEKRLDQNISLSMVGLTVAATRQGWQLSLNGTTSIKNTVISEEEEIGDVSRSDLDLTLGYQISPGWIIFTGYKEGDSDLNFEPRDPEEAENPDGHKDKYSHDGFFIGVSHFWRFEKAGRLTLSLGYADLTSTNIFTADVDDPDEEEELEFDDLTGRVKGDMDGFSYGITWSIPVSTHMIFQTKFKYNDYKQSVKFAGTQFPDVDDKYRSLSVGLAYVY